MKPSPAPVVRKRSRRPAEISLREMTLRDLPAVFALGNRLFTAERFPTLYRSWDEVALIQLFSSEAETCLVAETGGRVVGFALGQMMEKPHSAWRYGWLLWLGVSPRHTRSGVATRLVKALTKRFLERDARMMLVDTDEDNVEALGFFRRSGFGHEIKHTYLSLNLSGAQRARAAGR